MPINGTHLGEGCEQLEIVGFIVDHVGQHVGLLELQTKLLGVAESRPLVHPYHHLTSAIEGALGAARERERERERERCVLIV